MAIPLYTVYQRNDRKHLPASPKVPFNGKAVLICPVLAFGLAGVSALYQLGVRTFLIQDSAVAESVKNFDQTFQETTGLSAYIWSFLSVAIFGPIIEELIFRGILFTTLNQYMSGIWKVVISSVCFELWHENPMQMVYTGILGLGIGLAYSTTRNMWYPMMIHLFNNTLSQLPPSLMENETFVMVGMALRFVAILPMIWILFKMCQKNKELLFR